MPSLPASSASRSGRVESRSSGAGAARTAENHPVTLAREHVLADRYAVGELLGRGGMADVHRGTDRVLLRAVAIKLLRDVADPVQRERFIQEARTLASLNHPGLVTLLDAGFEDDRPYLVMELAEGLTLSQRLGDGPLPSDDVATIGCELAHALQYAHDRDVVHRDVKPSNVLLTDQRALLVDFGIARLIGSTEQHTRTGDAIGSPAYLAPEQVAGEPITAKTDVYSLGLVLLEALTAVRAYTGAPVEAAMARLHAAPAVPLSLEPGWRDLVTRMTHRDPAERPTAAEVAQSLGEPAHAGVPARAEYDDAEMTSELAMTTQVPLAEQAGAVTGPLAEQVGAVTGPLEIAVGVPERQRRRRLVPAAALALLVALAGTAFVFVQNRDSPASASRHATVIPATVPAAMRAPLLALHHGVAAVQDAVPSLSGTLDRIDHALATGRLVQGRHWLTTLVTATRNALAEKRISAAAAGRVTGPAQQLLALLPQRQVSAPPTAAGSSPGSAPKRPRSTPSGAAPSPTAPGPTSGPTVKPTPTTPATSAPPPSSPPPSEPVTTVSPTP